MFNSLRTSAFLLPLLAAVGAWGAPADQNSVWVSFSLADLQNPKAEGFPLKSPVFFNKRTAVFSITPEFLPVLSDFMHERFNRCGGFFTHPTRSQAEMDLADPKNSAGGPYAIDQQAVVEPLMNNVGESGLRHVIETMSAYHSRFYQSDTGVAASRWLAGQWEALAANFPGASVKLVKHPGWAQPSVILTIPGAIDPDELVVLGGHLDSISGYWGGGGKRAPGADDNASGIAVLTEAVRVLSSSGWRPKKTVEFLGYAAEEVGLRGSDEIARQYAKAGKKVAGVIQFDMTNFKGSSDSVYLLNDHTDPALTAFLGKLMDVYVRAPWGATECGYACSDHASWSKNGFPASAAFESAFDGMNNNIHSDRDTLANSGGTADHSVNFAKLAVAFAIELAKTAR